MRQKHTLEVKNIAMSTTAEVEIDALLRYNTFGLWWELLNDLNITLAISREYEHFIVLVGASTDGEPCISAMELPHPSGLFFDSTKNDLIVSSTRTPNQIFWLRQLNDNDYFRDILPSDFTRPSGTMFLPYKSILLPGTLYIHDLVLIKDNLYATITGHNFLAKLDSGGGWERVWWPKLLDGLGKNAFNQNYLQLNSIAINGSPETSFYTAFSDLTTGVKPWKQGYGPKDKGVVFDGQSREVLFRGLTCPHSAKMFQGNLWLCNSGYGEIGKIELANSNIVFEPIAKLKGFTRGLAFIGKYAFVGLSKVIDFYEPYAPGINPKTSLCAVAAINIESGEMVAMLDWLDGYQIYDIQIMPNIRDAHLPDKPNGNHDINEYLRYLG